MAQQRQPNTRLRDTIAETRWTYDAVASAVRRVAAENGEIIRTNKSAVAHWIEGTRPSGRVGQYLAEALSRRARRPITLAEIGLGTGDDPQAVTDDPVNAVADMGRADTERRRLLTAAAFTAAAVAMPLTYDHDAVSRMLKARIGTVTVGAEEINVIRQITAAFSAADEQLGGGHGLTTVTAYLAGTAAPMLNARFQTETLRRSAFGVVAELAYLAGFKHHDLGHEGAAQRYYLVGYQLACEADPHGHAAWMMRTLAHQALSLKRPHHCVDLVDHALRRGIGYVDGQTEALLHITQARAFAAVGERPAAARALIEAQDALSRDDGRNPRIRPSAAPPWAPSPATPHARSPTSATTRAPRKSTAPPWSDGTRPSTVASTCSRTPISATLSPPRPAQTKPCRHGRAQST